MEKTQFHTLMTQQVKIIYCLLVALGLLVIAALDIYERHQRFGAIAASFALGLVVYSVYLLMNRHRKTSPYPEWILVTFLLIFTLFGMHKNPLVAHWTYFVPIYTYFLFPFRLANVAMVFYSIALVLVVFGTFPHEIRTQVLFTYSACYLFSLMYALINDRHNNKLAEIINTDPLTQVYNEHQLLMDLNKEITRADRQRTELLLIGIQTPATWRTLKLDEYEHRLSQLAAALRKALRKYDTCYRLNDDNFVVIMPQSVEDESHVLQSNLRSRLHDGVGSFGDFPINAVQYQSDDDANSVLARVREGLYAG